MRWRRCSGRCVPANASRSRVSSPTAASSPTTARRASSRRKSRRCGPRPRAARPLRLNTGRIRDQWHTMTRTGASPRLGQHLPEPFVEIHPDDAGKYGVTDGGFARVTTDYGQCIAAKSWSVSGSSAACCSRRSTGASENASGARVGALVAPFTDPFSGQPENKATPASIAPYEYVFRGFALSRKPLELPAHAWWARVAVNGGYGYLFADNADLAGWQSWLKSRHGRRSRRVQGFWRRRLSRGVVCRRPHRDLPVRRAGARCRRLERRQGPVRGGCAQRDQRRMLLSGKSADGLANAGPIVCACFGVGRNTICDAIAAGANSAADDRRASSRPAPIAVPAFRN